jgi:hypothetical protein
MTGSGAAFVAADAGSVARVDGAGAFAFEF